MRKNNYFLVALLILFLTTFGSAHPLGNFSVNQYSRLTVDTSEITIRQILDLAEIPTFQLKDEIDADKNGALSEMELKSFAERLTPDYLSKLFLTLNSQPLEIKNGSKNVSLQQGESGLATLRIEWNLAAALPATNSVNRVSFENKNFADRIGWNEIVLNRAEGVNIFDSTAFGSGVTDELKAYPAGSLDVPLAERAADYSFSTGAVPENARPLQNREGQVTAPVQKDKLAELLAVPEITPAVALAGLLFAFALGAMHAMSPGHGKTIVGAYLVGSRGTTKHAAFLGLTVTITHTLGVFALGLITLFASDYILPERLLPFLGFVSGLLVLYIGLTMFKSRFMAIWGSETAEHDHARHQTEHSHPHEEDHSHEHDGNARHYDRHQHSHEHHSHDAFTHAHDGHTHSHLPPEKISLKNLLALGISGGLLPCPSALVLMLSAISLGRVGYGLVLTTAFSFGLAMTLTAVGLIFLYIGKAFGDSRFAENRIVKIIPVISAFVIACFGAVICYNSIG